MNKIELKNLVVKTIESEYERYDGEKCLSYELFIDDKPVSGSFDLTTFFEDKHSNYALSGRIHQYGGLFNSWKEKDQSSREYVSKCWSGKESWNYLDSCSCGHAGCAGIWNGVKIKRKKYTIEYRATKEDGYDQGILGSGKLFLKFPIEQVLTIRKQLTKLALDYKPNEEPKETIYKLYSDF